MPIQVQPGGAASQKALRLVAAVSAAEASFASPGVGQPSVVDQAGQAVNGLNPVARCLAEAAGQETAAKLLGSTAEEQGMVAQWMTFCTTELHDITDAKLFQINAHLLNRTYVAVSRLTLADLLLFSRLSTAMAALPLAQTDQLCNLLRWYDNLQHLAASAVADLYPIVTISKPRLDCSPLQSPAPQASAKPSTSSASDSSTATKGAVPSQKGGKPDKGTATAEKGKAKEAGAPAEDGKQAKKEKKEKKEKPAPQKQEVAVSVAMADIRVGTITKVWQHPNAEALYCEEIDLGEEKPRQVVSGLVKFVPEAEMLNRRVVVVCNLKPAKMRDVMSYGMVLCSSNEAHDKVVPLAPPDGVPNGERVTFEGYEGEPEEVLNPKKKIWEKISPDLATNDSGTPHYKGAVFMTTKGPCASPIANGSVN